jgi:ABC-type uncharacterized transport system permease subunit
MLKRYLPFFRAGAMDLMAFKFAVFTWVIVTMFQVACTIFLWLAVYQNSPDAIINGFTIQEMITFQVFINIYTFVTFDNNTGYTINQEIKDGTIAMSFVKPISYRLRFIATNLGSFSVLMFMFGVPLLTIAYVVLSLIGFITIKYGVDSYEVGEKVYSSPSRGLFSTTIFGTTSKTSSKDDEYIQLTKSEYAKLVSKINQLTEIINKIK